MAREGNSEVNLVIKYLLFFINFIIFVVSAAVVGLMIWILVLKEKKVNSVYDFVLDGACVFLVVGLIACKVSLFGWIGAFRENVCALKYYYWSMTILFFIQILAIIFVFVIVFVPEARTQLGVYPEESLQGAIRKYRDDPDMQDLIDNFQKTFKCCGTSNDDMGYKDWTKNVYFNCSVDKAMQMKFEFCSVPFSCCIQHAGEIQNLMCGKDMQSDNIDPAVRTNTIYTKGCLKAITDLMNANVIVVGGVIIGILVPQMLLTWLSRKLTTQIMRQISKWNRLPRPR